MIKFNQILVLATLLGLVISCSSAKTTVSQPEELRNENQFDYYNSGNKISYHLSHDEKYLYIRLRTEDRTSLMKVLRTGLTIYFDKKGKRNKDTYLEYPMAGEVQMPVGNMLRNGNQNDQNIVNLIRQIPTDAIFVEGDKLERFDISGKHQIQALLVPENRTSIRYILAMPIDRIVEDPSELANISIGVVSGKFQMPNFNQGMAAGRRMSGARPGGTMNRGPGGSGNAQSMTQPIVLWMKVYIKDS